jgi:hypothetical protein
MCLLLTLACRSGFYSLFDDAESGINDAERTDFQSEHGHSATPGQNVGTSGGAPAVLPDDPPPVAPNFEAPRVLCRRRARRR